VPTHFRSVAFREFSTFVTKCVSDGSNPLLDQPWFGNDTYEEFSVPTVFRFLPLRDGHPCSLADAKLLYQAMNEDLSATMDASGPSQRQLLLSQYCHVGQPGRNSAALGGNAGALGVSADARLVSENRSRGDEESAIGGLRPNIAKMRIVFDRLQFLLD
jgi:hypothetical protein